MIEIKIDKLQAITRGDAKGDAKDIVVETATAVVLLRDILSNVIETDDLARQLMLQFLTNEAEFQRFREISDTECKEVIEDA